MDYIDYAWGTWVLGYDKQQLAFLQNLLGQVTATRLGLLFAIAAGVSLLPYLVVRLFNRRRDKADPRDALIRLFCAKLARAGLPRRTGEGIQDFTRRVAARRPDLAAEALAIADAYVTQRYDVRAAQHIDVLRQRVRRFNAEEAWGWVRGVRVS